MTDRRKGANDTADGQNLPPACRRFAVGLSCLASVDIASFFALGHA